MKTRIDAIILTVICALLVGAYFLTQSGKNNNTIDEPAAVETFNTSYLERWDKGEDNGTIRMVGAWFFNYEPSSNMTVVEDESGNLWAVRDVTIDEDDFLLLWIANNGTPDYQDDDQVIKTWKEAR